MKPNETITWDSDPIIGQRASGTSVGKGWTARWEGVYEGIVRDEEDGDLVHRFHDATVNGTHQAHFGFCAGVRSGLTEVVSGLRFA